MILYPYICKYFKLPVGHSIIHLGDECMDIEACLRKEVLIKCSIVPPEKLYQPVFPFRCDNKLMFCLCIMCILTSVEKWAHTRDEDCVLTGTWLMDELRLTVE